MLRMYTSVVKGCGLWHLNKQHTRYVNSLNKYRDIMLYTVL